MREIKLQRSKCTNCYFRLKTSHFQHFFVVVKLLPKFHCVGTITNTRQPSQRNATLKRSTQQWTETFNFGNEQRDRLGRNEVWSRPLFANDWRLQTLSRSVRLGSEENKLSWITTDWKQRRRDVIVVVVLRSRSSVRRTHIWVAG